MMITSSYHHGIGARHPANTYLDSGLGNSSSVQLDQALTSSTHNLYGFTTDYNSYAMASPAQSIVHSNNIRVGNIDAPAMNSPESQSYHPASVASAPGLAGSHYMGGAESTAHYSALGFEGISGSGEMWPPGYNQNATYPYDTSYGSQYPFNARYCGVDFDESVRRKNATRESTNTLKAWLQEHKKNPYPTKGEKIMLAIITKMTLTQVSTWFANARRRLKKENKMTWKPKNRSSDSNINSKKTEVDEDEASQQSPCSDLKSDNDNFEDTLKESINCWDEITKSSDVDGKNLLKNNGISVSSFARDGSIQTVENALTNDEVPLSFPYSSSNELECTYANFRKETFNENHTTDHFKPSVDTTSTSFDAFETTFQNGSVSLENIHLHARTPISSMKNSQTATLHKSLPGLMSGRLKSAYGSFPNVNTLSKSEDADFTTQYRRFNTDLNCTMNIQAPITTQGGENSKHLYRSQANFESATPFYCSAGPNSGSVDPSYKDISRHTSANDSYKLNMASFEPKNLFATNYTYPSYQQNNNLLYSPSINHSEGTIKQMQGNGTVALHQQSSKYQRFC